MKRTRITVTSHAGYRGEEYPRSFIVALGKIEIAEIKSRWTGQDAEGGSQKRYFRVSGSDGGIYLLSCDVMTGEWFLENSSARGNHG